METNAYKPTLGEYFSKDVAEKVVSRNQLGKLVIKGFELMQVSLWVFQKGAVLGRAKSSKIKALASLVIEKGSEDEMCEYFYKTTEIIAPYVKKADFNFYDFFNIIRFPSVDFSNLKELKQFFETSFPLENILPKFDEDVARGLGFGTQKSELLEKMWVETYEADTRAEWERARRFGLDLPKKQTHMPLIKMEELVLLQTSAFVRNYCPELIDPLGLDIERY